jgi:hypothetical protein
MKTFTQLPALLILHKKLIEKLNRKKKEMKVSKIESSSRSENFFSSLRRATPDTH